MGERTQRPIPREEPEPEVEPGEEPAFAKEGPTTVRPPPPSSNLANEGDDVATYQKLRESCRVKAVDQAQLDDELAVEAEVLRVALDRKTQKPGPL